MSALGSGALVACVGDEPTAATPAGSEAGAPEAASPDDSAPPPPPTDASSDAGPSMDADAANAPPPIVTDVAAGAAFGCAVLSDTTVMCWGLSNLGQTAQPTSADQSCGGSPCTPPMRVPGLTGVTHVLQDRAGAARLG